MKRERIEKSITNRDGESISRYLKDIKDKGLITLDKELELSGRIKLGDRKAESELVEANLRFVISIAKQYQHLGLDLEDLVSEGNIGLIKAANKFESDKGFKFITYAVWWIRQSILQAISEHSRTIRLPQNKIALINKIKSSQSQLEQQFGRDVDLSEVADEMGLSVDKIDFETTSKSLDSQISDGEMTLLDLIKSDSKTDLLMDIESDKIMVGGLLDKLDARSRLVLEKSFGICGEELSISEISELLGVSQERVRQIKKSAIIKLKS